MRCPNCAARPHADCIRCDATGYVYGAGAEMDERCATDAQRSAVLRVLARAHRLAATHEADVIASGLARGAQPERFAKWLGDELASEVARAFKRAA